MKRRLIVFLLLATLLLLTNCFHSQEKLTILHWNDFHAFNKPNQARLENGEKAVVGGAAVLKGYINKFRAEEKNVALVHAGDDFQGTPISNITEGMSQIKLLNLIHPDVFTIGNHEFDYGLPALRTAISQATFDIVSANIFDEEKNETFVKPYIIKKFGKIRVGFIGVIIPDLPSLTLPESIAGLKMLDPKVEVEKYVKIIQDSVDLVVVVSHMGLEYDEQLARDVDGIDIIIGGHLHRALFEPVIVNNVIICQAGSHGKYLGKLDIEFDLSKKKIVDYKSELVTTYAEKIQPDPAVQALVDSLEQIVDKELNAVIGELKTDWIRSRSGESNVGNWETDVMREYTGTDIAFQNSGGIRKDVFKGKITLRDMWELNPFANYFVVFEMTGRELRQTLERNSSGEGEFLQVSGVRYRFNEKDPVGNRVEKMWVKGKPVEDTKIYSVCTNNFLVGIFEEAFGFPADDRKMKSLNEIDRDIFIKAVKQQKEISSKIEGRIVK